MLRSQMGPCGLERAAEYANTLVNSAPPPREVDPKIFLRQMVALLAGYPDQACKHVSIEYPRKNASCSIKRVCEALDAAKHEMECQIAERQSHLRRLETQPEPERVLTHEERIEGIRRTQATLHEIRDKRGPMWVAVRRLGERLIAELEKPDAKDYRAMGEGHG